MATHCVFEEAGMTLPSAEHTPAIPALQKVGYSHNPVSDTAQADQLTNSAHPPEETLRVNRLTPKGCLPQ